MGADGGAEDLGTVSTTNPVTLSDASRFKKKEEKTRLRKVLVDVATFGTLWAMLQLFLYRWAAQRVLMWTEAWAGNDPGFPQPNTNTKRHISQINAKALSMCFENRRG